MKKITDNIKFPYPVLGLNGNMENSPICIDGDLENINGELRISYHIELNDEYIENLIKSDKAKLVCEVDCAPGFFRQCTTQNSYDFMLKIPENSLVDDFTVAITVVSTIETKDYNNPNQLDAFKEFGPYKISKGNLLAYIFYKKYNLESAKNVADFITLEEKNTSEIDYNFNGSSIKISIPKDMFRIYMKSMNGKKMMPVAMASIVNQALLLALMEMPDHWQNRWARLIRQWVENEIDSNYEWDDVQESGVEPLEASKFVNKMLSNPHENLFKLVDTL